jgi:hypothetical protein
VPTNDAPSRLESFAARSSHRRRVFIAVGVGCALALSALEIATRRQAAPLLLNLVVISTAIPLLHAWRGASGTALRPALVWAILALAVLLSANLLALGEPAAGGRHGTGRLTYISVLCLLAAFGSVLNARVPGSRVWAGLMALLVLVFLIPWLEAPLRMRRAEGIAPLHLDSPWNLFFLFMVAVGVTNYLPTRFALAAAGFAVTFCLEYVALTHADWPPERRATFWSWIAWAFASSVWIARWRADHGPSSRLPLERLWFWFRDAWGVVWALRIQERLNRTADLKHWPVRLSWFGLVTTGAREGDHAVSVPDEAIADFRALARRFVTAERVEQLLKDCSLKSRVGTIAAR